jgi:hypothetical protein
MAQLAMGLAGAAVGFAIGGPAGAQWGFTIGTAAGGVLFAPKLPDGPRLNDRQVMSSAYGETIPRVYGAYVVAGNVIWSTDLKETKNTEGGKGGGPEYTYYTYSVSCAISLCQGPIVGVRRIWADGKLFYDGRQTVDELFDDPTLATQAFLRITNPLYSGLNVYRGTELQDPDPTIVSFEGDAPAYRGEAYVVFTDLQLEKFGNRLPQFKFEVVSLGQENEPKVLLYDTQIPGEGTDTGGWWHVNDPETNRVWFPNYLQGQLGGVYDVKEKRFLKQLVPSRYPNVSVYNIKDICYVPPRQTETGFTPREMWVLSYQYNLPAPQPYSEWYIDIFDPDSLELKDTIVFPDASVFQNDPEVLIYNPKLHHVVVMTQGAFANYFPVYNCFTRTLVGTFSKINNFAYDGFYWGNCIVSTTLLFFVGSNGGYQVWDATTYQQKAAVEIDSVVAIPQPGDAFFNEKFVPVYAVDTRRNRLVMMSRFKNNSTTPNLTNWLIFDEDMNVIDKGTVNLEFISGITSIFYSATTDEIWTSPSPLFGSYILDARTMQIKKYLSQMQLGQRGMQYAVEAAQYPGNYFEIRQINSGVDGFTVDILNVNPTVERNKVPLKDIVEAECALVGLEPTDLDTTNLDGFCRGFMVTGQGSIRGGLEALMNAYQFDCAESGGKLKFVSRSKGARAKIEITDLASHDPGSDVPTALPFTRADEIAQPKSLTVKYADFENEYMQGAQTAQRYTTKAESEIVVEMPVAMRPGEAKQVATIAMYSAWVARTNTKFTTSWKHSNLEPSDVVTIDGNQIRIVKKMLTGNRLEFEGALDNGSIYAQKPISGQTEVATQTVQATTKTNALLLDIRALRDTDSDTGFYVAAGGYDSGWNGAVIFKSIDDGVSYFEYDVITTESVIGVTTNALAPSSENVLDEINAVTVRLINSSQSLSSTTFEALLNGANACLIGNEILQFTTATLNADDSYTLTGLLRGRRGSLTTGHAVSDRFVLLNSATLRRAVMESAELNLLRYYKFPTIGTLVQNASGIGFTNTGQALKPVAPVHLGGGRDAAGNITLNWIRSSRINTEWRDYIDVPVGETSESYDIDVINAATSPPTVVRTLTATTSTISYTAAQQTTDFGSTPLSVTFRVRQRSSTYGLGDAAEFVLGPASTGTVYTGTISYSLGVGGAGGVNAVNGSAGTASTLSYSAVSLTANGGAGGTYNNNANANGGTASGGLINATGGIGSGSAADDGGGGGGGINGGTPNTSDTNGGDTGGSAVDLAGLAAALVGTGYTLGTGGARGGTSTSPGNGINGGNVSATAIGAGGGGAGYYGGNGGDGGPGGGGGGAAGFSATNMAGGDGGNGLLVIQINNTTTTVLTSGTSYSIPSDTTSIRVWLIGAGGGGAGATNLDTAAGGGGGAGGVAHYAWL